MTNKLIKSADKNTHISEFKLCDYGHNNLVPYTYLRAKDKR